MNYPEEITRIHTHENPTHFVPKITNNARFKININFDNSGTKSGLKFFRVSCCTLIIFTGSGLGIMKEVNPATIKNRKALYNTAFYLAIFTILYNIAEGIIAVLFGYEDESLTLFGLGVDSFIEMISGLGIAHMIVRLGKNPESDPDEFEKTALRVTGYAFYILVSGLVITGSYNLFTGHKPESSIWGVVISVLSIVVMYVLISGKLKTGRQLKSKAILADAECTRVCIYMSLVLLFSSGIYYFTGFAYADVLGTFGLAWFSFREGRECFEKAKGHASCSCHE